MRKPSKRIVGNSFSGLFLSVSGGSNVICSRVRGTTLAAVLSIIQQRTWLALVEREWHRLLRYAVCGSWAIQCVWLWRLHEHMIWKIQEHTIEILFVWMDYWFCLFIKFIMKHFFGKSKKNNYSFILAHNTNVLNSPSLGQLNAHRSLYLWVDLLSTCKLTGVTIVGWLG